jgi:hypothetical protein
LERIVADDSDPSALTLSAWGRHLGVVRLLLAKRPAATTHEAYTVSCVLDLAKSAFGFRVE